MRTRAQTKLIREKEFPSLLPVPSAPIPTEPPPTVKPRPGSASTKKTQPTTRSARIRKSKADKLPSRITEFLNSVDPTQWSFENVKAYMDEKGLGSKIKWGLKAKLEEMVNSTTEGGERYQAATRVLQEMNSHKAFSTPAAAFRISSGALTNSTVIYSHSSTIINGSVPTPAGNHLVASQGSPTQSDSSNPKYGPSDITSFLSIYPTLRTRFEFNTDKRRTSLEELLYSYLCNKSTTNDDLLLQAGFMDLAQEPRLLSSAELRIINSALSMESENNTTRHEIIACIRECFQGCQTFVSFAHARDAFSCEVCKYTPLFEQASSAILYTVHLLQNDISRLYPLLEGNFDVIWSHIIDRAFISYHGILHRKEKTSSLSPYKFDGLYISEGSIVPQEWLVLEVSRSSNQGTKQINDRQKTLQHCLRILNDRRCYLSSRTNLQGVELMTSLRKFPVWGILCQGFTIEIVRLGWLTRGVGLMSTFVSKYPVHIAKIHNLYRILEEVHMLVSLIQSSVNAWDELHESMKGN